MSTTLTPPQHLPADHRPSPSTGAPGARRGRIPHRIAFWTIAATLVSFAAASAVPSPLYVVYQEAWGFSAGTLTAVFAVYVVGLLGSLLVVGALSDHVGRRPVLAGAIALESLSLVLFMLADGVPVLAAARVLQGIATGAAFTTLAAALVDLQPRHDEGRAGLVNGVAPLVGLSAGALGCGALVEFGPSPTTLVYAVVLAAMLVAAACVARMPETSTMRPGARASLVPRVAIPPRLRGDVVALVPVLVAAWSLGGLYLSLGPSVAAGIFGLESHLVGGLVVFLLCGVGAVTASCLRGWEPSALLAPAAALLAGGMAVTLVGLEVTSVPLAALGTVVAGAGFGAAGLGTFGTLARIATPGERGELFAVAFVISYTAFSLPAVVAGIATTALGLRTTGLAYGVGVIVAAVTALVLLRAAAASRVAARV